MDGDPKGAAERLSLIEGLVLRPGARDVVRLGVTVSGQFPRLVRTFADNAERRRTVAIVTGAYMAWADPAAAETDGPVGVAVLSAALAALGATPVVVTDEPCEAVTRACLEAVGLGSLVVVPIDVTEAEVVARMADIRASQLVAVERLGPNQAGQVMTMRAVDITKYTAPLHAAFEATAVPTGAIGDGGNEIGTANVPVDVVAGTVAHGETIACRTHVRDLLISGTSNWGCYGVVSGLASLLPHRADRLREFLDPAFDEHVLAAATAAGGIDGVTGKPGRSVDGIPVDDYRELLLALGDLAV